MLIAGSLEEMSCSQCNCWRSKDAVRIMFRKRYASYLEPGIKQFFAFSMWALLLTGHMAMIPGKEHAYGDETHRVATRAAIKGYHDGCEINTKRKLLSVAYGVRS